MMKKFVLPLALLTGCGPVPVQISKQEQTQRQSVKQEVANELAAEQQSSHASEARQGTNSMPVIIICNQLNSSRSTCVTPKDKGMLGDAWEERVKTGK